MRTISACCLSVSLKLSEEVKVEAILVDGAHESRSDYEGGAGLRGIAEGALLWERCGRRTPSVDTSGKVRPRTHFKNQQRAGSASHPLQLPPRVTKFTYRNYPVNGNRVREIKFLVSRLSPSALSRSLPCSKSDTLFTVS